MRSLHGCVVGSICVLALACGRAELDVDLPADREFRIQRMPNGSRLFITHHRESDLIIDGPVELPDGDIIAPRVEVYGGDGVDYLELSNADGSSNTVNDTIYVSARANTDQLSGSIDGARISGLGMAGGIGYSADDPVSVVVIRWESDDVLSVTTPSPNLVMVFADPQTDTVTGCTQDCAINPQWNSVISISDDRKNKNKNKRR